jgi:hypothetical protein
MRNPNNVFKTPVKRKLIFSFFHSLCDDILSCNMSVCRYSKK